VNQPHTRRTAITCLFSALAVVLIAASQEPAPSPAPLPAEVDATLGRITADSLRGHLSFLASDLLEGRQTPSRGLDLAAEYIAAQFRRAGLEPIGDDGYFQTAPWRSLAFADDGFELVLQQDDRITPVAGGQISLRDVDRAIEIRRAPVVKIAAATAGDQPLPALDHLKGKAALIEEPDPAAARTPALRESRSAFFRLRERLIDAGVALILTVDRKSSKGRGLGPDRLINPDLAQPQRARPGGPARTPLLTIHDPRAVARLDALATGPSTMTLSLRLGEPIEHPIKLRNVAGMLRGSDPKLKETYLLVTAHYDHLGSSPALPDDQIYNGANDDGSGTVSVIELAAALASASPRPRRSLIFMTFFGEERGMLGSRYYVRHPLVPHQATVACVNLEQVGRTDATDGPQVATASMTGFDYSTLGTTFESAGREMGIRVFKHPRFSDPYFRASDNISFAERGIPAATICVAYQYPDYHGVGDHWEKIDFANMARVDRMIGLGLLSVANDQQPPRWNPSNPRAERFIKAARQK
jgi:Peptidase family M28